ncbi:MAG: FAD-binding protein [Anaerolineae bacterium]|nr:FAD-binding protein [Anaerolineae bacterium]
MPNMQSVEEFLHELRPRVSGDLRTDQYSRMLYSTDASIYQQMPLAVLIPRTADDVQAAVELAARHHVPVLPRASGSSLAGQAVNEALVIDSTRWLDGIHEINREERWVRVGPGRVLDELNLALKPHGLQFGPDPASSNRAAMGGIVSNNSTGSHSILYGMTADHVHEAEVILADGSRTRMAPLGDEALRQHQMKDGLEGHVYRETVRLARDNADIIRAGTPRHWRRCGGYNLDRFIEGGVSFNWPQDEYFNLAKLLSGAEGTLGVLTELKLNLVPLPRMTALAIVHYDDLFTALSAVPAMLETGPSAIELLDNLGLTLCRDVPEYARLLQTFVDGHPNCILITEFYGDSEAELHSKIERLKRHLQAQKIDAGVIVPVIDPQRQQDVWTVRKVGLGLMMSIRGDHKPIPFIEDAAVPTDHLAEYVTQLEGFCQGLGTRVAYYAHASAGCLHIRPLINTKQAQEISKMSQILDFSVDLLHGYGGALSSEHGDGRAGSWINERFFGPELYGLYQQVKRNFDPDNILNPGNIVDGPSMNDSLRYGDSYSVIPIRTALDFSDEEGFHRAVEMCNGAGVCRKKTTGTMCPSFMVTREEEHSTRGRANALRAAMSGLLPTEEMTSERMYGVMDLCIGCKACAAECPSSVDMGKIKVEFLAQYYRQHGTPLRARLFGNIGPLSRFGTGPLAPLVNAGMRHPVVRNIMERTLGVSQHRSLPEFASESFISWFRNRGSPQGSAKQVVLFNDSFNTWNDPHIAIAATEVLEALGYEVLLPGHRCCGRPMMSGGLVEDARRAAQDVVTRLTRFVDDGIPVVGLEPSCLLMLRDEYRYLLPDDERVQRVADKALLFEEFISQLADRGELNLEFEQAARKLLLHGHCHQRALVGTGPSLRAMALPENYDVEEVDSGCCGMAGSFGYECEHYELSMKMAERRLLPAVREADADTLIVAAGTSCRHQISHGSGREALHPAEVLRNALANSGDPGQR